MKDMHTRTTKEFEKFLGWLNRGLYSVQVTPLDVPKAGRKQEVSLHIYQEECGMLGREAKGVWLRRDAERGRQLFGSHLEVFSIDDRRSSEVDILQLDPSSGMRSCGKEEI
jgi:hypothetical protein